MEKLSLKIYISYVVYAILFYAIAIIVHNNSGANISESKSGILGVIDVILFWCVTNFYFLISLIVTSLAGTIYSIFRRKEFLRSFTVILFTSGILLLGILIFG